MDKVNRIEDVRNKTYDRLRNREKSIQKIREISFWLVASSFYFEKTSTPRDSGKKEVRGTHDGFMPSLEDIN